MTEKEPDSFYHDLRRKLEPYGSPPPESVWAGIRPQLPPQRPARWRRRLPGLLAVLLLSITATTFYWRPLFQQKSAKRPATSTVSTPLKQSSAEQATNSLANEVDSSASVALTAPATTGSAAATSAPNFDQLNSSVPATEWKSDARPTAPTTRGLNRQQLNGRSRLLDDHRQNRQQTKRSFLAASQSGPVPSAASRWQKYQPALARQTATRTRRGQKLLASNRPTERPISRQAQAVPPAAPAGPRAALATGPLAPRMLPAPLRPAEPTVGPLPAAALAPRQPTDREQRRRNWSVQLTGGPALSYRWLGGQPTQLEKLERPAWSGGGQVLGAYAFPGRLTVAGGLGFGQYATSLRYTLRSADSSQTRQVDFRDVYNFVRVPVQAQLTLGSNHRWRYGVLGGGAVALFTGARVSEGSACHCGQRRWRPTTTDSTNSRYQRLNLALTVGAFADYQLAPGRWLTVRPQGELFLNSVAPDSRAPRRPWSVGVQIGYRWDLGSN